MTNPGVAPGPGTAPPRNFPPQPGQAPINLTGPMPPMGNTNVQVTGCKCMKYFFATQNNISQ